MVGGTAALPQARGMDGGEPEDEEGEEVYVGHRKTKRRKHGHGEKVGLVVAASQAGLLGGGCDQNFHLPNDVVV